MATSTAPSKGSSVRIDQRMRNVGHAFTRATQPIRSVAKAAVFSLKVFPMLPSRPVDWVTQPPLIEKVTYPTRLGQAEGDLYRPSAAGPHPGIVVCLGVVPFGVDHPQGELCRNTEKEITTANLWHDMGVEAYHTRKEAVCCAVYHQHSALAHPFCPMCRRWCSSYLASFSNPFWPGSVIWSIAWSSCAVPAIRSSSWLNSMTSLQLWLPATAIITLRAPKAPLRPIRLSSLCAPSSCVPGPRPAPIPSWN